MDCGEEIDPPFFFLQGSHALSRFCTVDIAVVMKVFDYVLVTATELRMWY